MGSRNSVLRLVIFLLLLVPRSENPLDLLGPLNLSAAVVAVLGLEEDLALAVIAEESLL
jgi:hypothetical protein